MNRLILTTLSLGFSLATVSVAGAQDALILTGVIDGPLTGGTPKAIELYVAEDVADLAVYAVGSANNGEGTDGPEFILSGTASEGDFLYVASEQPQFNAFFGFDPDYTSAAANINGDDGIELFYDASGAFSGSEQVVDRFGEIGVDGTGRFWDYADGWAYRAEGTGPDGFSFDPFHWSYSGTNALDGETTNATATTPFPTATYTPGVVVSQNVYDGAGWRLLSTPVSGLTVRDLGEINLVQGIPAGAFNQAEYAAADVNLYTEYTGGDTAGSYNAPADTDEIVEPGRGFWWYWFDEDIGVNPGGTSQSFELSLFVLSASGPAEEADVTESFTNNADDFYMIGNPFPVSLDLQATIGPSSITTSVGTLQSSLYLYDPETSAYVVRSFSQEFPPALAAWQGAFAEITGTGGADPTVTYESDEADGTCDNIPSTCEFVGRVAAEAGLALRLDGTLASGAAVADRTANLRLLDDAEIGWDRHDLSELASPNAEAATLALVGERDGEPRRQGVLSLPMSIDGTRTIPVAFSATGNGSFAVSWDAAVLPSGWTATLRDRVTASESDLAAEGTYAFDAEATEWTERFEVLLSANAVATEAGADAEAWVGDMYPNPAVGAVRLGVRLGAAQRVTATVFDAIGRQVAVAFEGDLAVGTQDLDLDLDTSALAPGVYVVHVAGETFAESRRLVVTR